MFFWRATSRAGYVLVLFLLWVGVVVFPTKSFAQATAPTATPTPPPSADNLMENPYGFRMSVEDQQAYFNVVNEGCSTPSLECLVHNVSQFTAFEWVNNIMGPDQMAFLPTTDSGASKPMAAGGAVGGLVGMVSSMYSHPAASSGKYVAYVLESANIVTPAYAQGLGFAALDPILDLWKTFRNIAYIFFVLLFVIIGFMIMFRQKMGQTAITAQQAIPRIILALVLVTFSYAIAGFAIDLMYLTMTLIIGVFSNVFPAGDNILGYNIFNLISTLITSVANFGENINLVQNIVGGFAGAENTATQIIGFLGGTMLTVILAIAVLIGTVRLFFELLKSYATIVLSVVVSPVLIAMDAIPGKRNFQVWIKTLVGHLSVFPTVLLVVVMFYVFTNGTVRATGGFMPPFLLGSGMSGNITSLMGLAIILALPDIVKHIRDAIAPKNGFAEMVTKSGVDNFKAGWSGKGLGGWGVKRGAKIAVGAPLAAAGGAVGYKYADKKAKELGYEGRRLHAARLGGLLAGTAIAPRLPGLAKSKSGGLISQLGQAQAVRFVDDIQVAAKRRRQQAEQQVAQAAAQEERGAVPAADKGTRVSGSASNDPTTSGF